MMIKKVALGFYSFVIFSTLFLNGADLYDSVTIVDSKHYSNVFGEIRNYRVFLPPGYFTDKQKRYPVIYFYHGWSQRYFGSGPDGYNHFEKGTDNNGDNIAAFVLKNDVIVVKPDGYNRSPGDGYYLRPYNIGPVETPRQFPLYFPELVRHIDETYRTIPDRSHRAISGLSMGGFMSFWIGGKYPDLICAIGNFCGSAEFVAGPKDFPVEYRHIDLFKNYQGVNVRLNYGNEDFIRYYHRDLNKVWLQVMDNYEYEVYEAAHSTCGMGEMFGFLVSTFEYPPQPPDNWNHIDVYPVFTIWDYRITSDRDMPGFTVLEKVNPKGFKCSVLQHLPDGETMPFVYISVKTPPVYERNTNYIINDLDLTGRSILSYSLTSDNSGSLTIPFNGNTHEIGINKANGGANISFASFEVSNMKYARHLQDVGISVTLINKGIQKGESIKATLTAFRKSAVISKSESDFGDIGMNGTARSKKDFVFRTVADTTLIERFKLVITDKKNNTWSEYFEVPVYRDDLPEIKDYQIADGSRIIVSGRGVDADTLVLGTGNSDGVANPGESVVILVRDGDKLRRTEILVSDAQLNTNGENKRLSDYWGTYDHVGGSAKYSVPVISANCPKDYVLSTVVEYWLPDYPDHIIKQGIVNMKIAGSDITPPSMEWTKVSGDNTIMVKVIDGAAVKSVSARLSLQKDSLKIIHVDLNDDGNNGDRQRNDRVFSFRIPVRGFGLYNAEISATDQNGNKTAVTAHDSFVIH